MTQVGSTFIKLDLGDFSNQISKKNVEAYMCFSRMSICRRSVQWGLHTRNWLLLNCDRQSLDTVSKLTADALQGRNKVSFTPMKDSGDYVVLYNTRR